MAGSFISRRRAVVLLVLTSLLLITFDVRGNGVVDRGRSAFARVLSPFDSAAQAISDPLVDTWRAIDHYDELERENEQLRDQLQHQRGDDIQARAAILENQQMLALNALPGAAGLPTLTARVVGNAPGNFQNTVEIDRGSDQGIAVGMPVTNGAGIIGKITKVFAEHSLVLLITDPQYSISAKVLTTAADATSTTAQPPDETTPSGESVTDLTSTTTTTTTTVPEEAPAAGGSTTTTTPGADEATGSTAPGGTTTTTVVLDVGRETGALQGDGFGRPLVLRFVDDSSTRGRLTVGASVRTAGGTSSLAPPDLNIGVVSKIGKSSGTSAPVVEVEPAADLDSLDFVTVVLYSPNPSAVGR